ncbi:hypothetical protein IWZ00DRAFT_159720 [Phyllosticta capitalensis]
MDNQSEKKRLGFLDLPGEIRNAIYEEIFPSDKAVEIDFNPDASHIPDETLSPEASDVLMGIYQDSKVRPPPKCEAGSMLKINVRRATPTPRTKASGKRRPREPDWTRVLCGGLLETCHQVHQEAASFLYSRPVFKFSSPNALDHFLKTVRPENLEHIKHVFIAHCTRREACSEVSEFSKDRHDQKWIDVMQKAAEKLTNLHDLRIRLFIRELPVRIDPSHHWAQAILAFATTQQATNDAETTAAHRKARLPEISIELRLWYLENYLYYSDRNTLIVTQLHILFAEALRRRMIGWSEADALADFNEMNSQKWALLDRSYTHWEIWTDRGLEYLPVYDFLEH